jgi:diguanylate cyclase (GGDEF)-like protein
MSRWRPAAVVTFVGFGMIAAVIMASALGILAQRDDALASYRMASANLDVALAAEADQSLEAVDMALRQVAAQIHPPTDPTAPVWHGVLLGLETDSLLSAGLQGMPQVRAIGIVDSAGRLAAASGGWPIANVNLSDRDDYRAFLAQSDGEIYVSGPLSGISGERLMYLGRRMTAPDGAFAGVVVAALDLGYYSAFYRAVGMQDGRMVALVRRDGTILAGSPQASPIIGIRVPDVDGWAEAVRAGGGTLNGADDRLGAQRIITVQPLHDYPLVVNIGASRAAVLREWRHHAADVAIGTGCAVICLLMLLRLLVRQFHRLERARRRLLGIAKVSRCTAARLRQSEQRLAEGQATLQTTLELMDQGIMKVSADGEVMVWNRRVAELLDLPMALLEQHPRYHDVLAYQLDHGEFDDDPAMVEAAKLILSRPFHEAVHPRNYDRRRPNGRTIEARTVSMPGGGIVRTYTDITERKAHEERIRYFAHHDDLTRLANRVMFQERLAEALDVARSVQRRVAVLFLDLDRFKMVNDTRGHEVGDRLLAMAAARMLGCARSTDTVARMGGDEFAIVQPAAEQPAAAETLAARLLAALREPFEIGGTASDVGVSIGIALFPDHGTDGDALLRQADVAMYCAKQMGRGVYMLPPPMEHSATEAA